MDRYYQNLLEAAFRGKGSKQLPPHHCNEGYCCLCDAFQAAVERKSWRVAWRLWVGTARSAGAYCEAQTKQQDALREALNEQLDESEGRLI